MATRLQRYDFGAMRDFRKPAPASVLAEETAIELPQTPPPPPQFSEQELANARATAHGEGYESGFAAGLAQAAATADAAHTNATDAINRLGEQLGTLENRYADLLARESQDLSELVLMIARKVAGDALDTHYADAINTLVAQCLPVFFSRPRLLIDVHPDALQTVSARIEPLLQQQGFEGEIQFRSNAALAPYDALLDWGQGQARRSTELLWQEVESLLQKLPLSSSIAHNVPAPVTAAPDTLSDAEFSVVPITPDPGA